MTEEHANEARQALDDLSATLATLSKMVSDIDPALYTEDAGKPRLVDALKHLLSAEDLLAEIVADNNEAQEGSEFPFEAWDLMARQPVTVTGWNEHHDNRLNITPGGFSHPQYITTAFPAWYIRAQQAQADAADEADTLDDVRNGGAL